MDENKVTQFKQKLFGITGAGLLLVNIHMGDQLGLYKHLAEAYPAGVSTNELASKSGTDARYVAEWLLNQYVNCIVMRVGEDGPTGSGLYYITPEQAACLATDGGPHDVMGGLESAIGIANQVHLVIENMKTGKGLPWPEQHPHVHSGCRRFFTPLYKYLLTQSIVPALPGLEEKLKAGIRVADIGCGQGVSTRTMAVAYPNSQFFGVDYHKGSIAFALKHNVAANVTFTSEDAIAFCGDSRFNLVCIFDCFHDMADPIAAAAHFREILSDDGNILLIEPMAGDTIEANKNPLSQIYTGFSTTCCLQCAKSIPGGAGLGTMAPKSKYTEIFTKAGFSTVELVDVPQAVANRIFLISV